MMKLKLITPASEMPVTLDEAKAFYRVIGNEEDADVLRSINAATEKAEQITNLQICTATYEGYMDAFPVSVVLPKPPLVSVQKVEYIDADGLTQPFTDYDLDDIANPAVIYFDSRPSDVKTDGVNNVIVTFEAGYSDVPDAIQSWVLIYGLTLFENRENIVVGASFSAEGKQYYDHLLDSFRIVPL